LRQLNAGSLLDWHRFANAWKRIDNGKMHEAALFLRRWGFPLRLLHAMARRSLRRGAGMPTLKTKDGELEFSTARIVRGR